MPLVKAKCTECGAPIEVNPNAEKLICRYCGNEFIVEKAINNYNVSINASVVNNNFNGAVIYMNNDSYPSKYNYRFLTLRYKRQLRDIGGSVIFYVDEKMVYSAGKSFNEKIQITDEAHSIRAELRDNLTGNTQKTNIINIECGNKEYIIEVHNHIIAAPEIYIVKK